MVAATISSPNTSAQRPKGRLLVTRIEPVS
jgi:hypothetical protein